MKQLLQLAILVAFAACRALPDAVIEAAPPVAATTRLARVLPASSLGWLEAPARALAAPDATAVVSVPLSARIVQLRVQPGDHVDKGAPLIDVIMPELIGAAGSMSAANIRLDAYEKRRGRLLPLSQEGLVRAGDLTELDAQIALAKADREIARASLRAAGLSDEQGLKLLSGNGSVVLRAPIAGMVVAVQAKLGEMRDPGVGPLLEIAAAASTLIEARFSVPPADDAELIWIASGRSVALSQHARSPAAAREDGARIVWLRAKSSAESPIAQAIGRVRVLPPAAWSVIPTRALVRSADRTFVIVPAGSNRREKPVAIVRETANECVVTGLQVGEEVFVAAEYELGAAP
jgi:multidrug efflux pump subunit AcrA (membrane-fusion protein)